ncbi:MAG TPA: GNAT family N-acetyltransferase [Xanthobacteraceae bacterium]
MGRPRPSLFAQPLATWERDGLKATLARAGLPADDLADEGPLFWRFERDDMPAGFAGIEVHGTDAVLRSLVTLPPVRLQGVGGAMVDKMETEARARGVRAIYVMTGDSVAFFSKLGYAPCARERVPAAIAATAPFAGAAAATAMMKQV